MEDFSGILPCPEFVYFLTVVGCVSHPMMA